MAHSSRPRRSRARAFLLLSASLAALHYAPAHAETVLAGEVRTFSNHEFVSYSDVLQVDGTLEIRTGAALDVFSGIRPSLVVGAGGYVSVQDMNSRLITDGVLVDGGLMEVGRDTRLDVFGSVLVRNGGRLRYDGNTANFHFNNETVVEGENSYLSYAGDSFATGLFGTVVRDGGTLEFSDGRREDLFALRLEDGRLLVRDRAEVHVYDPLVVDGADRVEVRSGATLKSMNGDISVAGGTIDVDGGILRGTNNLNVSAGGVAEVRNSGLLDVGRIVVDFTGRLAFASGAAISGPGVSEVFNSGTITVDGAGSDLEASSINNTGGNIEVSNGARIASPNGTIMNGPDASLTVSGAETSMVAAQIVNSGGAALVLSDGATAVSGSLEADSGASITVSKGGAADVDWLSLKDGRLVVAEGGTVDVLAGPDGAQSTLEAGLHSSGAALEVSGPGSAVRMAGTLRMGTALSDGQGPAVPSALLRVQDGGLVSVDKIEASDSSVPTFGMSAGGRRIEVEGEGSVLEARTALSFGSAVGEQIRVGDGGTLRVAGGEGTLSLHEGLILVGGTYEGGYEESPVVTAGRAGVLDVGRVDLGRTEGEMQGQSAALIFSHTDQDYVFEADTSGYGVVGFLNGTTRVTGDLAHEGPSIVYNGTAIVDGTQRGMMLMQGLSFSGDPLARPQAVLRGQGTVGQVVVGNDALVQGGDDATIGTLHAAGAVSFGAGSAYRSRIAADGRADALVSDGQIDISADARLELTAWDALEAYQPNSTYTILTGQQGLTGTFGSVVEDFAYLNAEVDYTATDLVVTLARATVEPPVVDPEPPVVDPQPPVVDPEPPVVDPEPPVVDPQPPVVDPQPPVVDPQPPVVDPQPPVVDPEPPVVDPQPPVVDPQPPVVDPEPPVVDPQPPVVDPQPPVVDPEPPVVDPEPPVVDPQPPVIPPVVGPPVVEPTPISFASMAGTLNASAAAKAVEAMGAQTKLYRSVLFLREGEAGPVLQQLSGEIHPSVAGAFLDRAQVARSMVAGRALESIEARGVWAQIADARTDATGGEAADAATNGHTMMVGVDTRLDSGWVVGGAFGGERFDVSSGVARADVDGYVGAVYAQRELGAVRLAFGAVHGRAGVETSRSIGASTLSETLNGETDASTTQVFVEAARGIERGALTITPHVGLAHAWTHVDGFAETGGVSALNVRASDVERTTASVGVRMERDMKLRGADVTLSGGVAYERAFGGTSATSSVSFAGSDSFQVVAPQSSRDVVRVDLGLDIALSPNAKLTATYGGAFGDAGDASTIGVAFGMKF